jgi:hypothetical protein
VHDGGAIGVVKFLPDVPAIREGASNPDGTDRIEAVGILDDLAFQGRWLVRYREAPTRR